MGLEVYAVGEDKDRLRIHKNSDSKRYFGSQSTQRNRPTNPLSAQSFSVDGCRSVMDSHREQQSSLRQESLRPTSSGRLEKALCELNAYDK